MPNLYLDIETYSSEDLLKCGVYKYAESFDFEILILCYKIDDGPVIPISLATGESIPSELIEMLKSPDYVKHAHNAAFERLCLRAIGIDIPIDQWECSAVKAAYCGLPLSLDGVSKALKLGDLAKDVKGKALIRYFSVPVKPTKANGGRSRNLPYHDLEKWAEYVDYCCKDVIAEYTFLQMLKKYEITEFEKILYQLDQKINDRGIKIDKNIACNAYNIDQKANAEIRAELISLTDVSNPGSAEQLKDWLSEEMGEKINSLSKETLPDLIKKSGSDTAAAKVLELRVKGAKTSVKKYTAMLNCMAQDGRAHGLFQFYGANRTGRWAGRLIQLQNLPQNHIKDLDYVRNLVKNNDYDTLSLTYSSIGDLLSQLVRTAFVADEGKTYAVADFAAIEARVIAWLADEDWRLDVFNSHGKIYEASASMMFNVPIDSISYVDEFGEKQEGPNYYMRALGKVAELALGYQGALGAMKTMGGEKMGLSNMQMEEIVTKWRYANKGIVAMWGIIENCALQCVITGRTKIGVKGILFDYDGKVMTITLPSGRSLYYQNPRLVINQWRKQALAYSGMIQSTKTWGTVDTYGGKLVENIVQAISRDLLAEAMYHLDSQGFDIVMHVHDEIVAEVDKESASGHLKYMLGTMSYTPKWAHGLPLKGSGYITDYYKKD